MLTTTLTLTISAWTVFAAYASWLVFKAKRNVPITLQEAKTLWHIHKKESACKAHKWEPVSPRGELAKGFKCECGYKYVQKKPLVSSAAKIGS
jgi:hypothetical protein